VYRTCLTSCNVYKTKIGPYAPLVNGVQDKCVKNKNPKTGLKWPDLSCTVGTACCPAGDPAYDACCKSTGLPTAVIAPGASVSDSKAFDKCFPTKCPKKGLFLYNMDDAGAGKKVITLDVGINAPRTYKTQVRYFLKKGDTAPMEVCASAVTKGTKCRTITLTGAKFSGTDVTNTKLQYTGKTGLIFDLDVGTVTFTFKLAKGAKAGSAVKFLEFVVPECNAPVTCQSKDRVGWSPCFRDSLCTTSTEQAGSRRVNRYTCAACGTTRDSKGYNRNPAVPMSKGSQGTAGTAKPGCLDDDECNSGKAGCSPCKNTPGSFTCAGCPSGFKGGKRKIPHYLVGASLKKFGKSIETDPLKSDKATGGYAVGAIQKLCVDVNECRDPKKCDPKKTCTNVKGTEKCLLCGGIRFACPTSGPNKGCAMERKDYSKADPSTDASNGCSTIACGDYECGSCKAGYRENKATGVCEDINECTEIYTTKYGEKSRGGCDPLTDCVNADGGYYCAECPASAPGDSKVAVFAPAGKYTDPKTKTTYVCNSDYPKDLTKFPQYKACWVDCKVDKKKYPAVWYPDPRNPSVGVWGPTDKCCATKEYSSSDIAKAKGLASGHPLYNDKSKFPCACAAQKEAFFSGNMPTNCVAKSTPDKANEKIRGCFVPEKVIGNEYYDESNTTQVVTVIVMILISLGLIALVVAVCCLQIFAQHGNFLLGNKTKARK